MKCRTYFAILLANISAVLFVYRPWPLLHFIGNTSQIIVVVMLLGVSILLLWSTVPRPRVDPSGKAVFITGCDGGFGKELAQRLDRMGYHVFAGCLATDGEVGRSLNECSSDRLKLVPVDVTDDVQVLQAVKFVTSNIGANKLWAVVNNAGKALYCSIKWDSLQKFQQLLDSNVLGIVRVSMAFLPLLRQSEGRIINVTSLAGELSLPGYAAYYMTKKASVAFSDALREGVMEFNVTVVTVEPAIYKSSITHESYLPSHQQIGGRDTPTESGVDHNDEYFKASQNEATVHLKQAPPDTQKVFGDVIDAVCSQQPNHRYFPDWMSRLRAAIAPHFHIFNVAGKEMLK